MKPPASQITFLRTDKFADSCEFAERVLRLDLAMDQGGCRIYRVTDAAYLGYCDREVGNYRASGLMFTFVVDDVDDWYERLGQSGLNVDGKPRKSDEYQIYHFFFEDPNGYQMEVQRFLDDNWDQSKS